ncbi:MAG: hypothetical protein M3441_26140 [Chloroflexota bacterium]|nr:hypothetical protein [Chloroflexota bacterium]
MYVELDGEKIFAWRYANIAKLEEAAQMAGISPTTMRRSMETEAYLHVIGMGSEADWEAGRGSFYFIEDKNGEKCIPVFTSPERADRFARANFDNPEAHMQMLESIGVIHAPALTSGRFIVMPLRAEGLARAAAKVEADYLVRDPRPGDQQDIMRVPK